MNYVEKFGLVHSLGVRRDVYVQWVVHTYNPNVKITLDLKQKLFSVFKEYLKTKVFFLILINFFLEH